ncbi:MAG TPA: glutathione transferase GstA [Labilithrix sp.]
MKLFYSPGACSLATNIALREAGVAFDLEQVDLETKRTKTGRDYWTVNAKGYVPALQLDSGEVLTENVAVLPYVADMRATRRLAPPYGTLARTRFTEWLGFVSTEIHKTYAPLFDPHMPDEAKQAAKDKLAKRLAYVDAQLAENAFVTGNDFTVVDAYLFTVTRWASKVGVDLAPFQALRKYMDRIGARPAVKAALDAEAHGETHADVLAAA